jgi:hypothetical protein
MTWRTISARSYHSEAVAGPLPNTTSKATTPAPPSPPGAGPTAARASHACAPGIAQHRRASSNAAATLPPPDILIPLTTSTMASALVPWK